MIEAFEATLQEAAEADVLLHVVDAANPHFPEQMTQVQRVLADIGAQDIAQILVFNKCDLLPEAKQSPLPSDEFDLDGVPTPRLFVSARSGQGLEGLRSLLAQRLLAARSGTEREPWHATHDDQDR